MSRQPDFSTSPGRTTPVPAWETLVLALALVAAAACAAAAYRCRGEAREAAARTSDARRQLEDQQARLRALAPAAAAAGPGAAEATPRRIVGAIGAVLPGDARLMQLAIGYERSVSVEMQVDARRAAAWDRLIASMERSPDFAEVELGPEDREAEVRTTLRARWTGASR